MSIIDDFYDEGRFLRRWSFEDGKAVCIADALEVAVASPEELAETLAANDVVRQQVAQYRSPPLDEGA